MDDVNCDHDVSGLEMATTSTSPVWLCVDSDSLLGKPPITDSVDTHQQLEVSRRVLVGVGVG